MWANKSDYADDGVMFSARLLSRFKRLRDTRQSSAVGAKSLGRPRRKGPSEWRLSRNSSRLFIVNGNDDLKSKSQPLEVFIRLAVQTTGCGIFIQGTHQNDDWARTNDGAIIFWVPPGQQGGLFWPQTVAIIGSPTIDRIVQGLQWELCRTASDWHDFV